MNINNKYINNNTNNYTTSNRTTNDINWIVIHYTANPESTAEANAQYYQSGNTNGVSAHYFVDWNGIWAGVREKDIAGHCGKWSNTYYLTECNNTNSIGIEMCCHSMSGMKASQLTGKERDLYIDEKTMQSTVELVSDIMKRYGIDKSHILRHYDVHSGRKMCPRPFVGDDINTYYKTSGNQMWKQFLEMLDTPVIVTPTTPPSADHIYRVRKSWNDVSSQKGAFASFENAKKCANKYKGYFVFDENGTSLYPIQTQITTSKICQIYKVNSPDGILNMRSEPDSSDNRNIIKKLKNNDYVLALKEQSDGWFYVKHAVDNRVYEGWVFKKYLTADNGLYRKTVDSPDGTLNIRSSYNVKSSLIATMGNGFNFIVLKLVNDMNWGLIWCGETIGYANITDTYSKRT